MKNLVNYEILAEWFRYPYPGLENFKEGWRKTVSGYNPGLLRKLDPFISHLSARTLENQQEYYISTFDVQALCHLDIGYVLFGEDYRRGVFLMHVKKEQETAGNDCGKELHDHLPNMLTLLPKIRDTELAEELVYSVLIPALKKMIRNFRTNDNVYKGLLEILVSIMDMDYPVSAFERFIFEERGNAGFVQGARQETDFPEMQ